MHCCRPPRLTPRLTRRRRPADPPVWAVQREALLDAGGLDEALWSIGVVDDLSRRMTRLGATVEHLGLRDIAVSATSYPYHPSFAMFLASRNRLRTAFVNAPADGPRRGTDRARW